MKDILEGIVNIIRSALIVFPKKINNLFATEEKKSNTHRKS